MFFVTGMSCTSYYNLKSSFYHLLTSSPYINTSLNEVINNAINTLLTSTNTKGMGEWVGVHYRAYDWNFDWEVVPPQNGLLGQDTIDVTTSGNEAAVGWESTSPLSAFVEVLKDARGGEGRRFLAFSNSMNSKDYLVRSFQNGVVYKIDYGIGGVEVVKGFVDWVVLGKCGMIVHR